MKKGDTVYYGLIEDIREQKDMENRLQKAQRMESIGTLAGGVAHDFNNILSSIIGFTELVIERTDKTTLEYRNLQEVMIAGNRAKNLVKQILTFSRQAEQAEKPIQVSLIVKETLKLLRASLPSTISIKQNIKSESLVMGDPTQVHQIVMNLCTNAFQAMEKEGGILTINLFNKEIDKSHQLENPEMREGIYLCLEVSDTGCGMTPELVDRIFVPFFTTRKKGEGTGLGLSVVHGIVHSHGGHIYVKSEENRGTNFQIFFPVLKTHHQILAENDPVPPQGSGHILFVDDETQIINMGKQMLGSLGYTVTALNSGLKALELFKVKKDQFDLVVTDMTMPGMTGLKLAENLKLLRPDIPIVLCSGFSDTISEEEVMSRGICKVVAKPVLKYDMARTLKDILN